MFNSLYMKMVSNSRASIIMLSLVLFSFLIVFSFLNGPIHSPDSSTYKMWAELLIEHDFNLYQFHEQTNGALLLRMIFIGIVALLYFSMGDAWGYGLMLLNCVSLALVAYMLMQLSRKMGMGFWGIGFVFFSMFLIYEQLFWVAYALSDTTFELFTTGVFFAVGCALIHTDQKAKRNWLITAGTIFILAMFYRPSIPTVLPFLLAGIFIVGLQIYYPEVQALAMRWFFIVSMSAGFLFMVIWAWYLSHPELWQDGPFQVTVQFAHRYIEQGVIVHDRPNTFTLPPSSMFDILVIEFKRLLAFFQFYTPMFSRFHNLINTVTFGPLYILVLIGSGVSIRSIFRQNYQPQLIGLFAIIFIMSLAIFHAMTLIDYDWRYRIPCYPPLIILALLGAKTIKEKLFRLNIDSVKPYAI